MNIQLISPYHGGSHADWATGYINHSNHQIQTLTLPARYWKWRMHGGAITLAQQFNEIDFEPDLILATDMLDMTTFLALTRQNSSTIPSVLYMHENQLTYPLPQNGRIGPMRRQLGERDQHYAFINYASMMAADHICFNSSYHLNSFFEALPRFLKHYPEYNELESIDTLKEKCTVLPVGIQTHVKPSKIEKSDLPLILWNQRWEYDKNPDLFFNTLFQLSEEGFAFKLAICGESFGKRPLIFEQAADKLEHHIIHMGFAEQELYEHLLWQADFVISTAVHEFFGISILEAVSCHTFPILPNRLSYPEIFPKELHEQILYSSEEELFQKLRYWLLNVHEAKKVQNTLSTTSKKYAWAEIASEYDKLFTTLLN